MSRRAALGATLTSALTAASACTEPSGDDSTGEPAASGSAGAGSRTVSAGGSEAPAAGAGWRMPDEGEPHTRTWMAFGVSETVWGTELVPIVRRNLADIANAVAAHEPVSMLVRPDEQDVARALLDDRVTLVPHALDDLWIRDTGPVFVGRASALGGLDFHFNGWGRKQEYAADATVAGAVTTAAGAASVTTDLVLEGGAIEVDGQGSALITRSCVLNDNRNPGWSAARVEAELARVLGIRTVIWLPGIAGKDITDGHTDFYARFVAPGHVVAALDDDPASYDHDVTRAHLEILRAAKDAQGRRLTVTTLTAPTRLRAADAGADFAAGYLNFYVANGVVIAPQFGDPDADAAAAATLGGLFPGRSIVQVNIDGIAAGGGGIHCATQQQPALG